MDADQRWVLRRLYHHMTNEEIAEKMGVRVESVVRYARLEKLHRQRELPPRNREPWTEREIALLRAWWPDEDGREVAAWLGRKYDAVRRKASNLGLRKSAESLHAQRAKGAQQARISGTRVDPNEVGSRLRFIV